MTFLQELKALPNCRATVGTDIWTWGGKAGSDPHNAEHVEHARVAGGVFAWALSVTDPPRVQNGAATAKAAGARFGLRISPFPLSRYDNPETPGKVYSPTYDGPELQAELDYNFEILRKARLASGDVPIHMVAVDSESWERDANTLGDDRIEWNEGIRLRHNELSDVIEVAIGPVPILFYGMTPVHKVVSLHERTPMASVALYRPLNPDYQEAYLKRTIEFQFARGLLSTAAFVSLGAGYKAATNKSEWDWALDPPPETSASLGKLLNRWEYRSAGPIIDYTGWEVDRMPTGVWQAHFLAFAKAYMGIV